MSFWLETSWWAEVLRSPFVGGLEGWKECPVRVSIIYIFPVFGSSQVNSSDGSFCWSWVNIFKYRWEDLKSNSYTSEINTSLGFDFFATFPPLGDQGTPLWWVPLEVRLLFIFLFELKVNRLSVDGRLKENPFLARKRWIMSMKKLMTSVCFWAFIRKSSDQYYYLIPEILWRL